MRDVLIGEITKNRIGWQTLHRRQTSAMEGLLFENRYAENKENIFLKTPHCNIDT